MSTRPDGAHDDTVLASRWRGGSIAALGVVGLIASMILTHEHFAALRAEAAGEDFAPACDLGSVVSCSASINSAASHLWGLPGAVFGVAGFAAVATLGAVLLLGGRLSRTGWFALQAGTVVGIVAATWLQYQSIAVIGALCPYCMVVWATMIPLFVLVSQGTARLVVPGSRVDGLLTHWGGLLVVLWYVAIGAAILFRFVPAP